MPYRDPGDLHSPAAQMSIKDMLRELFDKARSAITGTAGADGRLVAWDANGKLKDALVAAAAVPKAVNRQDNTTNNTVSNQLVQSGWGFIAGSAAGAVSETVTFPVAFDDVPIVVATPLGRRTTASGAPTSPADFNGNGGEFAELLAATASNFALYILTRDAATNLSASYNYGYSWIAIGPKAR